MRPNSRTNNRTITRGQASEYQTNSVEAKSEATQKSRYIPSLDGLRAFAVLAVIAYHFGLAWAPGGLLGVTVFFVLSGYLITGLLLAEWQRTKTIDLKAFWMRRIRRLVPAIVFLLLSCALLFTLFNHELLTKMRDDTIPALFFFSNWWYIFHDVSYFEALGAPSPLTHFWSLAIEEQFYIIWPVLLFILFKGGIKKRPLAIIITVLIVLSAGEMAFLYNPMEDPSRVYYGTDTRAFSLLIGALLALIGPSRLLGTRTVKTRRGASTFDTIPVPVLDGIGVAAFVGLCIMVCTMDGFSAFPYYGGVLLASLLSAVLIAVLAHPKSMIAKAAAIKPLTWIGKRSYGMYLWHYPIILLMNPIGAQEGPNAAYLLLQLAIIFACSAFSFHFVENPIRKGAIGKFINDFRSGTLNLSRAMKAHIIPTVASFLLIAVAVGGFALVPKTYGVDNLEALQSAAEETQTPDAEEVINDAAERSIEGTYDVLMIGDSVSAGTVSYFPDYFPNGHIDAAVNRNLWEGADVYLYYDGLGVIRNTVVFSLGTNNRVVDWQMDDLMNVIDPEVQCYFITVRSHLTEPMEATNATYFDAEKRFENIHVIDWYAASAGHEEYFDGDGTHLNAVGAAAYLNLVKTSIPL